MDAQPVRAKFVTGSYTTPEDSNRCARRFARAVAKYEYFEMPLSGLVHQGGVEYLFTCVTGQEAPDNFWAYRPVTATDRKSVESAR